MLRYPLRKKIVKVSSHLGLLNVFENLKCILSTLVTRCLLTQMKILSPTPDLASIETVVKKKSELKEEFSLFLKLHEACSYFFLERANELQK